MSSHLLPCGGSLCLWVTITVVWGILREPWLFPCGLRCGLVYLCPHRVPLAALLVCMWTGPHLGNVYPRPYMGSHSPLPVRADNSPHTLLGDPSAAAGHILQPVLRSKLDPSPACLRRIAQQFQGQPGRLPWLTCLPLRRQSIVWNCVLGQPVQVDLGASLQRAARLCLLPLCCSSWRWDTWATIPGNPRLYSQDLILSCYHLANRLGRKHSILRDSLALWLEDGHGLSDSVFWKTAVQDLCQPLHWHIILSLI